MVKMKQSGIEWVGEIPEHWNLEKIKYHLIEHVEKNNPIKTDEILSLTAKQGVIPYYMKTDFSGNKPKEDLTAYRLAYPGDIVMNSMNILTGSVGLSKYFGCVSPVYNMLRPINNSIDSVEYFNLVFQTKEFQRSLRGLGNGILIKETDDGNFNTVRVRIPMDKFKNIFVPIPPIEEQRSIASTLNQICGTLDNTKSDIENQIEILNEYKKSLITEAVTKGLDKNVELKESGIDWIEKIPEHWKLMKVKYVAKSLFRGNGITKEQVIKNGDIQCIRYGEIYSKYDNSFVESMTRTNVNLISSPKYIQYGDILFAITGELVEEIGKNIVYLGKDPCLVGGDILVMRHEGNAKYFNYVLNCKTSQEQKSFGKAKLKVVHSSSSDIGNMYITIPPIEEQEEIVTYLDSKCSEIESIIETKKQQLELLEEYKRSIIYEYVTGKRTPSAAHAKPDSATAQSTNAPMKLRGDLHHE